MAQPAIMPHAQKPAPVMAQLRFLDAGGALHERIDEVNAAFASCGAVHIANTGLAGKESLLSLMPSLGFGTEEQFDAGGRTTSSWQSKWAAPGLRRMDYYPPHLHLLPSCEIGYRRSLPARILFFCAAPPRTGGETFLHSAQKAAGLLAQSTGGKELLEKLLLHGQMFELGFLDEQHPGKADNYFQSWQERFGAKDRDAALAKAQSLSDEYDACWWAEDQGYGVLMTRITLPGFIAHAGGNALRFPRIAMDGPCARNGFRRFPLGTGQEFSVAEKSLLRRVYDATREECAWRQGDIILMDNILFGHSRAPFEGPREILLGMAGQVCIPPHKGEHHAQQN